MSRVVRNIGVFSNRIYCLSLQSVRFYPRWTHRTPSRIIEPEIKREPKASWRLEAEKEIVRSSPQFEVPLDELNNVNHRKKEKIHVKESHFNVRKADGAKYSEVREGNAFVGKKRNVKENSRPDKKVDYMNFLNKRNSENDVPPNTPKKTKSPVFAKGKKRIAIEAKLLKRMESAEKLGVPLFEKLGDDDTKLSTYVLNSKSERVRKKSQLLLMEGRRLIEDALAAGVVFKAIFFSRVEDIQSLPLPEKGIELYKMAYNSMLSWSDVSTCSGIIGFAKIPDIEAKRPASLPLTVICDNVRDPGNLGAILRTSAAVGCDSVVLTKGCVDLWNPKVLRAGAGAHFRLRIYKDVEWSDLDESVDEDANVFVADNDSFEVMICGSEGEGTTSDDASLQSAETGSSVETQSMPLLPYFGFNFTNACSLALIVGGETEGISEDAYNFLYQRHGLRLNVPLSNNIESLNIGTALGIITFEMKKQFLMKTIGGNEKQINNTNNVSTPIALQSSV